MASAGETKSENRKTGDLTSHKSFDSAYGFSFAVGYRPGSVYWGVGDQLSRSGAASSLGLIFGMPLLFRRSDRAVDYDARIFQTE